MIKAAWMPAPYPIELRERAVDAYESGSESYGVVAERFSVAIRPLQRWVKLRRETGSVEPKPRGGGNVSPVELEVLEAVMAERGDATSFELTAEYNRRVPRAHRVHRSSVHRALRRAGYVFKKNSYVPRSRHVLDVQQKRARFIRRLRIPAAVFTRPESHRARLGDHEETHPHRRSARSPGASQGGARGSSPSEASALPRVVRPCGLRRLAGWNSWSSAFVVNVDVDFDVDGNVDGDVPL